MTKSKATKLLEEIKLIESKIQDQKSYWICLMKMYYKEAYKINLGTIITINGLNYLAEEIIDSETCMMKLYGTVHSHWPAHKYNFKTKEFIK